MARGLQPRNDDCNGLVLVCARDSEDLRVGDLARTLRLASRPLSASPRFVLLSIHLACHSGLGRQ